jgi:hypothetical protein
MRGHRFLNQPLAAAAHPLAPHVPFDLEHARRVVESLTHILTDAFHPAAAAALGIIGLVRHITPREDGWQRYSAGLLFWSRGGLLPKNLELKADRFDIRLDAFIQERVLHNIELFAAPIKPPALQDRAANLSAGQHGLALYRQGGN